LLGHNADEAAFTMPRGVFTKNNFSIFMPKILYSEENSERTKLKQIVKGYIYEDISILLVQSPDLVSKPLN
jgi:hypothetical protein